MESNKVKGLIFPVGGEAQAFLADRDRPYRDMAQTGRNILIGAAIAAAVAAGAGGTYIYRKRHQIDDADDMME